MSVQGIGVQNNYYTAATAEAKKTEEAKKAEELKQQEEAVKQGDKFVKSQEETSVTYEVPKRLKAEQRQQIDDQRTASFQTMLKDMLGRQAGIANATENNGAVSMATIMGFAGTSDPTKAAASIAPGGEYSVDAVATRILDMAKSLAGGDESKIATLRKAVEKGFKAAGVELGGKLPSISTDTYNEVMKRFDAWEKGTDTAGTDVTATEK